MGDVVSIPQDVSGLSERCLTLADRGQVMWRKQSLGLLFLVCAALWLCGGCASAPVPTLDREEVITSEHDELLIAAQRMVRSDDYREFERAEFRLVALRIWRSEDVTIATWLAQLYVAWAEQLKNEISFLRLKGAAARIQNSEEDSRAVETLVDYRLAKLAEVEEKARTLCNMLRTYYPSHYTSHRVMADYFRVLGDREKMDTHLVIVEQLNPESGGYLFLKGAVLAEYEADYIQAVEYYDRAIKKDPEFVKAHYFKALAFHEMGRMDEARALMEDVLVRSPGHPGAKAYLAAESYLAKLTQEVKQQIANVNKDLQTKTTEPHLVYWVTQWANDLPNLLYRLGGATEFETDVRVRISLVLNEDQVIQTYEQNHIIPAGAFRSFSQTFLMPVITRTDTLDVVVQVLSRGPGDTEHHAVCTRQVRIPDMPRALQAGTGD